MRTMAALDAERVEALWSACSGPHTTAKKGARRVHNGLDRICHAGPADHAERDIAPLRAFGSPLKGG